MISSVSCTKRTLAVAAFTSAVPMNERALAAPGAALDTVWRCVGCGLPSGAGGLVIAPGPGPSAARGSCAFSATS